MTDPRYLFESSVHPPAASDGGDRAEVAEGRPGRVAAPGPVSSPPPLLAGPQLEPRLLLSTSELLAGRVVVVIGAGPVGRLVALIMALAGASVHIIDNDSLDTGQVNAGWLWPYHSTEGWANQLCMQAIRLWLDVYAHLLPMDVVAPVESVVQRRAGTPPFSPHLQQLDNFRRLDDCELHPGMAEGIRATTAVVPGNLLYPATDRLLDQCGVTRSRHTVSDRSQLRQLLKMSDIVINAAGLGVAYMLNDPEFQPLEGTVVRVKAPEGFTGAWAWETGTNSSPYAIHDPANNVVIVGGTTVRRTLREVRKWLDAGSPECEATADLLEQQIRDFAPSLAGAQRLNVRTGVRPVRSRLLLGPDEEDPRIIHLSGFGGFGVTIAPAVAHLALRLASNAVRSKRR